MFGVPLVMAQGASVRQKYLNYVSRIFFHVRSAITIGAGYIGAPLVLADYKEDECVRSASPIFMQIAYYFGFTNRKRKYFEEKMTATLKNKQTSIATVRYHLLPVASLLTPLIFHYPLPLRISKVIKIVHINIL
jgi:hypothetical protein